ncbi:hypothetical protein, partial [Xanthomonas axonopodis]|uniref:hypothetical protein n=1 Tax=Xanthomonas axonopodis TaxID=53413 RepID=UPI001C262985
LLAALSAAISVASTIVPERRLWFGSEFIRNGGKFSLSCPPSLFDRVHHLDAGSINGDVHDQHFCQGD